MATLRQLQQFGALIRERRGRMTATELGRAIGKSQSYVSAVENASIAKGQSHPITPPDDVLAALSAALEVPLTELHAALGRGEELSDRRGPIDTIIQEAGYDPDDMGDDEKAVLRGGIDALIVGTVERQRQERQKRKA